MKWLDTLKRKLLVGMVPVSLNETTFISLNSKCSIPVHHLKRIQMVVDRLQIELHTTIDLRYNNPK